MFTKKKVKLAKTKTENLMSTYLSQAVVVLNGSSKIYKEYFEWLDEFHKEWEYTYKESDGCVYVYVKKRGETNEQNL